MKAIKEFCVDMLKIILAMVIAAIFFNLVGLFLYFIN